MPRKSLSWSTLIALSAFSLAHAQSADAVAPVANPCPRPAAGSVVQNPRALFSSNGVLTVRFSYQHRFDAANRELFCLMTSDGLQNPTLRLNPGDHLVITATNNLPKGTTPWRSMPRTVAPQP